MNGPHWRLGPTEILKVAAWKGFSLTRVPRMTDSVATAIRVIAQSALFSGTCVRTGVTLSRRRSRA
jgi:hypothetical protein